MSGCPGLHCDGCGTGKVTITAGGVLALLGGIEYLTHRQEINHAADDLLEWLFITLVVLVVAGVITAATVIAIKIRAWRSRAVASSPNLIIVPARTAQAVAMPSSQAVAGPGRTITAALPAARPAYSQMPGYPQTAGGYAPRPAPSAVHGHQEPGALTQVGGRPPRNQQPQEARMSWSSKVRAVWQKAWDRVSVGDGTVQHNVFGAVPGEPGADPDQNVWDYLDGEPDEEPEPDWDPGDEVDDEGGRSEFDPMADEVARQESEHFGIRRLADDGLQHRMHLRCRRGLANTPGGKCMRCKVGDMPPGLAKSVATALLPVFNSDLPEATDGVVWAADRSAGPERSRPWTGECRTQSRPTQISKRPEQPGRRTTMTEQQQDTAGPAVMQPGGDTPQWWREASAEQHGSMAAAGPRAGRAAGHRQAVRPRPVGRDLPGQRGTAARAVGLLVARGRLLQALGRGPGGGDLRGPGRANRDRPAHGHRPGRGQAGHGSAEAGAGPRAGAYPQQVEQLQMRVRACEAGVAAAHPGTGSRGERYMDTGVPMPGWAPPGRRRRGRRLSTHGAAGITCSPAGPRTLSQRPRTKETR